MSSIFRSSSVVLMFAAAACLGGSARGASVPVANAGFEQPALGACGFGGPITGWTSVGDGGPWRCGSGGQCLNSYPGGPPEGLQIAYSNSTTISQVLTTNLEALKTYKLRVKVGRRLDCCFMTGYKVQLFAGATLLAEDPGLLNPANGTFLESVVEFTAGTNNPAIGQPLKIALVRAGVSGQANFDDVRLDANTADCNGNGIPDATDIAQGTSHDNNGNGLPDECESLCPADIAPAGGNGQVNIDDLFAVINNWGPCASGPCLAADIAPAGGNGQVNIDDLFTVINAWGPCP